MNPIYLIRHGKTQANLLHLYCGSTDLPLSQQGIDQLRTLHYHLPPVRFLTTGIISGMAYASPGSLYQQALYSIGLVLFLFIMLINVFLNVCIKNRKEG